MIINSNMYNNLYNIGSARSYASNVIKPLTSVRSSSRSNLANGLNSYYNPYRDAGEVMADSTLRYASENAKNLSALKSSAFKLGSAAYYSDASTFYSSNEDVATVKDSSFYSDTYSNYEIDVSQLTERQMSQSAGFESSAASYFESGVNSLNIEVGGLSYDVEFEVAAADTNYDVLTNLANSINSSGAPVTAAVLNEGDSSKLRLTSVEKGSKNAFEVKGPLDGKDASEKLEMREIQTAVDAKFKINGENYTSSTDSISLMGGDRGTIELHGIGSATLSQGVDASNIMSAATTFTQAYNKAISFIAMNSQIPNSASRALGMLNGMGSLTDSTKSRLAAMGITVDEEDGTIHMDRSKLLKAIESGPDTVKETLAGSSLDAATSLEQGARDVVMNMSSSGSTYNRFGGLQAGTGLINILMPRTGFLFDLSL